ncbi:ATP-binding protein [Streptomyces sp. NPDC046759]|uniref:ATP-binding protein n=1 Tax=Streptomyces sp. NPDC046759 TaxID=3155019 RepID=UPI0033D2CC8D
MKHSAAKTLGVAALGAAFAALGAGAASAAAAVPAVPDTQALDAVTHTLPGQSSGRTQSGATDALTRGQDALSRGQNALGTGVTAAQPAIQNALKGGPTGPLHSRLGGLPVQSLPTHGLPTHGLPVNGLALD